MNAVTLTSGMRQNLFSMQRTSKLLSINTTRLNTGKKVNSALDDPISFFTAISHMNKARDLMACKAGMGEAIQTIAAYHRQTSVPVVDILLADDAPQFKKITAELALCWIHEGRHYNRLDPIVPCNVDALKDFKTRFWDFYGDLLKHKKDPDPEKAAKLSMEFDELFLTKTIYDALNDRIEKTRKKKEELLKVLKYPWLPLHNNDSELGARVEKRRQDVSLHTISDAGTTAKDAFLTITQTAKKLGVNTFNYIHDRVSRNFNMPALSDLIIVKTMPQPG